MGLAAVSFLDHASSGRSWSETWPDRNQRQQMPRHCFVPPIPGTGRFEMKDINMPDTTDAMIDGIVCRTDFQAAAALDTLGQLLDIRSFPATTADYRATRHWLVPFCRIVAVLIESAGTFVSGLARSLTGAGCQMIKISQPYPHTRARQGKNDSIDTEAAAHKVLSSEAAGAAKDTTGIVEAIRRLSVARHGAVQIRTAAICAQLRPEKNRLDDPAHAA